MLLFLLNENPNFEDERIAQLKFQFEAEFQVKNSYCFSYLQTSENKGTKKRVLTPKD